MVAVALSPEVRALPLPPLNVQEHIEQLKAAARAEVAKGAGTDKEGDAEQDGSRAGSNEAGKTAGNARQAYLPPPEVAKTIPCRYFPSCTYGKSCLFFHPDGAAQENGDSQQMTNQDSNSGSSPAGQAAGGANGHSTSSPSNPYSQHGAYGEYPPAAQAQVIHPAAMGYYVPYEAANGGVNGQSGSGESPSMDQQQQYMHYAAAQQAAAYGYAPQGYAPYPGAAQHNSHMQQYHPHHPYAGGHNGYLPQQQVYSPPSQQKALSPAAATSSLPASSSHSNSANGQQELPSDPAIIHQQRSSVAYPNGKSPSPSNDAAAQDNRSTSPQTQNGQFAEPMSPSAANGQVVHAYIPPTGFYPMMMPEMMHPHHQQYMYPGMPSAISVQPEHTNGEHSRSPAQAQLDAEFAKASLNSSNPRSNSDSQKATSGDAQSGANNGTVQHAKHARLPSLHTFFQTTGESGPNGQATATPAGPSNGTGAAPAPRAGANSAYPRRLSSSVPPSAKRPFSSGTNRGPPPPYRSFPPQDARSVCVFFTRGICRFGDTCHLVHLLSPEKGGGDARPLRSRIINPAGDVASDAPGDRPAFGGHRQPFRPNPHHQHHPSAHDARYQAKSNGQQVVQAEQESVSQDLQNTATSASNVGLSQQGVNGQPASNDDKLKHEQGNVDVSKVEKLISETRNLPVYEKPVSPAADAHASVSTTMASAPRAASQPAPLARNGPSSGAHPSHARRGAPPAHQGARHNHHFAQRVPNGESDFPALKVPAAASASNAGALERSSSSGAETATSSAQATSSTSASSAAQDAGKAAVSASTADSAPTSPPAVQKAAFSWASAAAKAASLPDPPKRSASKARPAAAAPAAAATPALNEAVSTLDKEAATPAAIKA